VLIVEMRAEGSSETVEDVRRRNPASAWDFARGEEDTSTNPFGLNSSETIVVVAPPPSTMKGFVVDVPVSTTRDGEIAREEREFLNGDPSSTTGF
jgi:hypothetical protein